MFFAPLAGAIHAVTVEANRSSAKNLSKPMVEKNGQHSGNNVVSERALACNESTEINFEGRGRKGVDVKPKVIEANVPNYSFGTCQVSRYMCAGPSTKDLQRVPLTEPSGRRIDHAVSNLPIAVMRGSKLSLNEVIERFTRGEFGSTEVPSNQVW